MKIMIIRHAEPDYDIDGLTAKGHREAELLSQRLIRVPDITAIYQSPLGRAQLTASYTLEKLGRTAETLPWLAEFRAKAYDPVRGCKRICWDYHREQWVGHEPLYRGETWTQDPMFAESDAQQIWQETCTGVDEVLARHGYHHDGLFYRCEDNRADTLMFFCHFGVGAAMLAHLTGQSPMVLWHAFSMQPSSVTTLVSEERRKGEVQWRCFQLGDVSHLYAGDERISTAALYAECYDGRDTTDPIDWPPRRHHNG